MSYAGIKKKTGKFVYAQVPYCLVNGTSEGGISLLCEEDASATVLARFLPLVLSEDGFRVQIPTTDGFRQVGILELQNKEWVISGIRSGFVRLKLRQKAPVFEALMAASELILFGKTVL